MSVKEQKLTWQSVRVLLQRGSFDIGEDNAKSHCYQAITMFRRIFLSEPEKKLVREMILELTPEVRTGKLVPFKEIGRHILGHKWAVDVKSKEILMLLAQAAGFGEVLIGDRGVFVKLWT